MKCAGFCRKVGIFRNMMLVAVACLWPERPMDSPSRGCGPPAAGPAQDTNDGVSRCGNCSCGYNQCKPVSNLSDHDGIRRFFHRCRGLFFELSQRSRPRNRGEGVFRPSGANYSVCRSQMGASDFSYMLYNYDDVAGDFTLSHFNLSRDSTFILHGSRTRWLRTRILKSSVPPGALRDG